MSFHNLLFLFRIKSADGSSFTEHEVPFELLKIVISFLPPVPYHFTIMGVNKLLRDYITEFVFPHLRLLDIVEAQNRYDIEWEQVSSFFPSLKHLRCSKICGSLANLLSNFEVKRLDLVNASSRLYIKKYCEIHFIGCQENMITPIHLSNSRCFYENCIFEKASPKIIQLQKNGSNIFKMGHSEDEMSWAKYLIEKEKMYFNTTRLLQFSIRQKNLQLTNYILSRSVRFDVHTLFVLQIDSEDCMSAVMGFIFHRLETIKQNESQKESLNMLNQIFYALRRYCKSSQNHISSEKLKKIFFDIPKVSRAIKINQLEIKDQYSFKGLAAIIEVFGKELIRIDAFPLRLIVSTNFKASEIFQMCDFVEKDLKTRIGEIRDTLGCNVTHYLSNHLVHQQNRHFLLDFIKKYDLNFKKLVYEPNTAQVYSISNYIPFFTICELIFKQIDKNLFVNKLNGKSLLHICSISGGLSFQIIELLRQFMPEDFLEEKDNDGNNFIHLLRESHLFREDLHHIPNIASLVTALNNENKSALYAAVENGIQRFDSLLVHPNIYDMLCIPCCDGNTTVIHLLAKQFETHGLLLEEIMNIYPELMMFQSENSGNSDTPMKILLDFHPNFLASWKLIKQKFVEKWCDSPVNPDPSSEDHVIPIVYLARSMLKRKSNFLEAHILLYPKKKSTRDPFDPKKPNLFHRIVDIGDLKGLRTIKAMQDDRKINLRNDELNESLEGERDSTPFYCALVKSMSPSRSQSFHYIRLACTLSSMGAKLSYDVERKILNQAIHYPKLPLYLIGNGMGFSLNCKEQLADIMLLHLSFGNLDMDYSLWNHCTTLITGNSTSTAFEVMNLFGKMRKLSDVVEENSEWNEFSGTNMESCPLIKTIHNHIRPPEETTVFHMACNCGIFLWIEWFMKKARASKQLGNLIRQKDSHGNTPIHCLCLDNNAAGLCMKKNFDFLPQFKSIYHLMNKAVGDQEMCAIMNEQNLSGRNPIELANESNLKSIACFMETMVKGDSRDQDGISPLSSNSEKSDYSDNENQRKKRRRKPTPKKKSKRGRDTNPGKNQQKKRRKKTS